ncbi:MAG TPA: RraA family protein [Acidimicrobiales bacterium]|nr:RraA family protein [Acidimicrobiales bacterium]
MDHGGEDDASTGKTLLGLGAATLGESGARPFPARVRAVWPGAQLAAPAFPVRCTPADNLAVHVAVTVAPGGSALVVDVGNVAERGYWGEVLTTAAESRGLAGLVIDGCVRDVAALEAHGFPVFSAGVALPGASKREPGTAGVGTEVAGVLVEPGDWVVGDADGVVIVPGASMAEVVAAARARADKEQGLFGALRGGQTTVELLELDPSPVRTDVPAGNPS